MARHCRTTLGIGRPGHIQMEDGFTLGWREYLEGKVQTQGVDMMGGLSFRVWQCNFGEDQDGKLRGSDCEEDSGNQTGCQT